MPSPTFSLASALLTAGATVAAAYTYRNLPPTSAQSISQESLASSVPSSSSRNFSSNQEIFSSELSGTGVSLDPTASSIEAGGGRYSVIDETVWNAFQSLRTNYATAGAAAAVALAGAATAIAYFRGGIFMRPYRSRVVGIIPARFASSRFEGKPLAKILGKSMIQRTWEQAKQARLLQALVVATDDERIADYCRGFGAQVVMTSATCANGTERCHEALSKLPHPYDIVVNIQGDEPLVDPEVIDGVVMALQRAPEAVGSTAVTPLGALEATDRNRVKCVVDSRGHAIYFSRALIPHSKSGAPNVKFPYLLHLGLQCYDAKFLSEYAELAATPLQQEEDLEQLRVLEHGHKIKVITVEHEAHGVDTPADIITIETLMKARNMI